MIEYVAAAQLRRWNSL